MRRPSIRARRGRIRSPLRQRLDRYALAMAAPRTAHGFASRWSTSGGVRMHARVSAPPWPQAPTVVLVHGLAVSHRYLMPTARLLALRYQVHVVDLPGFGLSADPDHVLDPEEHADALGGWLDANQIGPAVLVANSFGCQVLVDLATRAPQRCLALVLSGPTVDPAAATATRQVLHGLLDLLHEDPFQLPILLRDLCDAGPVRVWATLRHALRDPITSKLPLLTVPTLVLRGAMEPIVTAAWARQVAVLVPGGQLATIPASPHNSVYVAADALTIEVHRFLSSVLTPGARTLADPAGGR